MYNLFKYLHVLTVNLSFGLFVVRGYWMIINSALLTRRWVRIVPHVNDTLLLGAALTVTYLSGWRIFTEGWFIAKLFAIFFYIVLGTIAIRPGHSKLVRIIAWLCALLVFAYIVLVAISKDPWPF